MVFTRVDGSPITTDLVVCLSDFALEVIETAPVGIPLFLSEADVPQHFSYDFTPNRKTIGIDKDKMRRRIWFDGRVQSPDTEERRLD